MRTSAKLLLSCIGLLYFNSCADKHADAKLYLENIKKLYQEGNYNTAKIKIDSIQILFPKAFDQIKEGMALLKDVRKTQNQEQIAYCDSVMNILSPKIDSMKKLFVLEVNKEYQEQGRYLSKKYSGYTLNGTTLRSNVREDGRFFIESVYVGSQKFHNKVKVSTKDGQYAETMPVTDDGLNFRFTDAGKQYEVIAFTGQDENGLGKFIANYTTEPLTVTLQGKNTTTYALSNDAKKSIADLYQLSVFMQNMDSLKVRKEKSSLLIEYLEKQKNGEKSEENTAVE